MPMCMGIKLSKILNGTETGQNPAEHHTFACIPKRRRHAAEKISIRLIFRTAVKNTKTRRRIVYKHIKKN